MILLPMYTAVLELSISKKKGFYFCKYSVHYGQYEVVCEASPKRMLGIVDRKIMNGYIVNGGITYKELVEAAIKSTF